MMKDNFVNRAMVRHAIRAAIKDPDKNIPKILALVERADANGNNATAYANLRRGFEDPKNN